jgi:hypothetical protein
MARRGQREGNRGEYLNDLVNAAVDHGWNEILQRHPNFRHQQEYIKEHIDQRKLTEQVRRINTFIAYNGQNWSDEEKGKYLFEGISNYVASGGMFDKQAKRVVLRESLEGRAGGKEGHWNGRLYHNEEDFEKASYAFRNMHDLMAEGKYAQDDPILQRDVYALKELGFYDQAWEVLYDQGVINEKDYKHGKNLIGMAAKKKTKSVVEKVGRHIESAAKEEELEEESSHQISASRVAAVFFGILGTLLLFTAGTTITGNVVGTGQIDNYFGLLGILFCLVAAAFIVYNKGK